MAVKFKDVPKSWQHPSGPYRQAPPEFGGEWWLVDFVRGPEPWLTEAEPPTADEAIATFGPRPQLSEYRALPNGRALFNAAKARWEQDIRLTQIYGWPQDWPELTPAVLANVAEIAAAYGMGAPKAYLGRYDWRVRFPQSLLRDFECSVFGLIHAFHLDVARYQSRLLQDFGVVPSPRHPFVPAHLWPADAETTKLVDAAMSMMAPLPGISTLAAAPPASQRSAARKSRAVVTRVKAKGKAQTAKGKK